MNLLLRGGYRSIRQGLRELVCDIKGMLALGGQTTTGPRLDSRISAVLYKVACSVPVAHAQPENAFQLF